MKMNRILLYIALFSCSTAFGQDSYFLNIHDKRISIGLFNYERAYVALGISDDVVNPVKFCSSDAELKCLISFGSFMVFAVPREMLSEGMGWDFAGYKFKVLQTRNVADDSLTLIESIPNISNADENRSNRLAASVIFLYSRKNGIVQFNNIHAGENIAGEAIGEYQYVFLDGGLDSDRFVQTGPIDRRLDSETIAKLRAPDLSPFEIIDEVFELGR